MTELRRQERWASVFFTLKDPEHGATLPVQMPRGQFDALELGLAEGERVHVFGRAELYEQRGELRLQGADDRALRPRGAPRRARTPEAGSSPREGLFDDARQARRCPASPG